MESSNPLQQAYNYVNSAWFPMASEAALVVREKILQGSYREQRQGAAVLKDVRCDFALYTYCMRELVRSGNERDAERTGLAAYSERALLQVLQTSPQHLDISASRELGPLQRLSQVLPLASAVIADEVATQVGLEPESAYSCALLRQLGLALVTWNYPHVVASAAASVRPGLSLDFILSRRLGFSPALLGLIITRDWDLPDDVRYAMGEKFSAKLSPELVERAEMLRRICRMGEMLTRVEHPAYPNAQPDFQEALRQIESLVGHDSLLRIRERLHVECLFVLQSLPSVLVGPVQEPLEPLHDVSETATRACPQEFLNVQRNIERMREGRSSPEKLLRVIDTDLFPLSGFESGCVYLLDPQALELVPRLGLGSANLTQLQVIELESALPVGRAFREGQPLIKRTEQGPIQYLLLGIGRPKRIGVLYLVPSGQKQDWMVSEEFLMATSLVLKQLLDKLV